MLLLTISSITPYDSRLRFWYLFRFICSFPGRLLSLEEYQAGHPSISQHKETGIPPEREVTDYELLLMIGKGPYICRDQRSELRTYNNMAVVSEAVPEDPPPHESAHDLCQDDKLLLGCWIYSIGTESGKKSKYIFFHIKYS
jgi:hypothetical protein